MRRSSVPSFLITQCWRLGPNRSIFCCLLSYMRILVLCLKMSYSQSFTASDVPQSSSLYVSEIFSVWLLNWRPVTSVGLLSSASSRLFVCDFSVWRPLLVLNFMHFWNDRQVYAFCFFILQKVSWIIPQICLSAQSCIQCLHSTVDLSEIFYQHNLLGAVWLWRNILKDHFQIASVIFTSV